MTKLKKILRYLSLYLALMCFLIGIRLAGYIIAQGYRSLPPELLLGLACMITFWMGAMLLFAGLLTEKEDGKAKQRRVLIWLGLILAVCSAAVFFAVLPTLPA